MTHAVALAGRSSPRSEGPRVLIVGAGLAGLVCARQLLLAGLDVQVLEMQDQVGGRIATDVTADGFRLDRGFQVLFAAYPALRRHTSLASLQPRWLASGVQIVDGAKQFVLGHPLFDVSSILPTLTQGAVTPSDVRAVLAMLVRSLGDGDRPLVASHETGKRRLQDFGAGDNFINRVIVPMMGGVTLDRSLDTDASFVGFVFRAMALGRIFLPALGIGELSRQLGALIPPAAVHLGARADSVIVEGGRAVGVQTDSGAMGGDVVVIATDAPVARTLTGVAMPVKRRTCTTVYFTADRAPESGKRLVVHAAGGLVNHLLWNSNVAPEYAPPGRPLLSVTVLRALHESDDAVVAAVLGDLATWYEPAGTMNLEPVSVQRVEYAQFAQEPGVYDHLPQPGTPVANLYLAGEYLHSSSTQGAMRGGEMAAVAVLRDLR